MVKALRLALVCWLLLGAAGHGEIQQPAPLQSIAGLTGSPSAADLAAQLLTCVNPKYMGAVMDGVADDSAPMQATINAAAGNGRGCIDVPEGTLRATNLQVANNNIRINCRVPGGAAAGGTSFLAADLTSTVLSVGPASGFFLRDCGFTSASRQTAGAFIDMEGVNSSGLENVRMSGGFDPLIVNDTTVVHFDNMQVRNWSDKLVSIGGTSANGSGDLYFYKTIADEDDASYTPVAGFYLTKSGGAVTITASDIIHAHNPFWVNPGANQFVDWVYIDNGFFDTCDPVGSPRGGIGILITPHNGGVANGGSFANPWSSTCTNSLNIAADTAAGSVATDYNFTNPRFLHDLQDSVVLGKSDNIYFTNPTIAGGSTSAPGAYNGIVLNAGADHIGIHAGHVGGNFATYGVTTKFGMVLNTGFGGALTVDGTDMTGNAIAAVYNGAAPNPKARIINSPGYNPVGLLAVAVGASPFVYQAGLSPETINIFGGTVSSVVLADPNGGASQPICNASPCMLALVPGQALSLTYSAAPTMTASRQ